MALLAPETAAMAIDATPLDVVAVSSIDRPSTSRVTDNSASPDSQLATVTWTVVLAELLSSILVGVHAIVFPPERDKLVQFITPAGAPALPAGRLREHLHARLDAGRGRDGLNDVAEAPQLIVALAVSVVKVHPMSSRYRRPPRQAFRMQRAGNTFAKS